GWVQFWDFEISIVTVVSLQSATRQMRTDVKVNGDERKRRAPPRCIGNWVIDDLHEDEKQLHYSVCVRIGESQHSQPLIEHVLKDMIRAIEISQAISGSD